MCKIFPKITKKKKKQQIEVLNNNNKNKNLYKMESKSSRIENKQMFQLIKNFILVKCLLNKNLEKLIKKTQKNKNEQNGFELEDNFVDKISQNFKISSI